MLIMNITASTGIINAFRVRAGIIEGFGPTIMNSIPMMK